MEKFRLTYSQAQSIFNRHSLGQVDSLEEIKSGSINPVFLLNTKYIIRVDLGNPEYKDKLKKESVLFDVLPKFSIPTPRLIVFDDSRKLLKFPFFIINYISGSNLADGFSKESKKTKNQLISELGNLLKNIHSVEMSGLEKSGLMGNVYDWVSKFKNNFQTYFSFVKANKYFPQETINQIERIFNDYRQISDWKSIACLTHGDINPGNIRINDGHIIGIFDFEYACIADPFIDLERFPINYQLGSDFNKEIFLNAYGTFNLSRQEIIRLKTYCINQGLWEIWATVTQQFAYGPNVIEEGRRLVNNTVDLNREKITLQ